MGKRDSKNSLTGNIEVDNAFFEIVDIEEKDELGNKIDNDKDLKRGRGNDKQMKVLVMLKVSQTQHKKI